MELQFRKTICSCLKQAVHEVKNLEQTQEVRLPDSMPDISRILGAWGQLIMRGKEWRGDRILSNGGMMVWVLYAPEDGTEPRCVDTWVPLQMEWDLQDTDREGMIRVRWMPRFVDARSVSPRKIMLRLGVAALGQAHVPMEDGTIPAEWYWEDYETIAADWACYAVTFDEAGMTVTFSPYEIAAYAFGPQVFTMSYEFLEPYLSEHAREVMGFMKN